ncbi:hypothetical protein V2J09_000243 [Rumex salicifolius]
MTFWGVEVKPGKPYTHLPSKTSGKLRLTQVDFQKKNICLLLFDIYASMFYHFSSKFDALFATFGFGISNKRSFVQCNVGNKSPVLLCCLLPEKSECCHLELEFDEEDKVVFSVIGPRSVHLTGYILSSNHRHSGFDDKCESYGEDIGHSDTEKSDCSDEDEYEDSFINDDDVKVSPPSPAFSSEEMEEEIMEDKESSEKKACPRRRRLRKCQISESEDDGSMSLKGSANGDIAGKLPENEDEDKIPISSLIRCGRTSDHQKLKKDEVVDDKMEDNSNGNANKCNGANGIVDADIKSETNIEHSSVPATLGDLQQNEGELKAGKKKSKKRQKKGDALHHESIGDDNSLCKHKHQVEETNEKCQEPANNKKPDAHAPQSDETKSKRKKRKIKGNEDLVSVEKKTVPSKDDTMTVEIEKPSLFGLKTFSNGLIVEEVELGNPDGELASLGRKVKIHCTGAIKEGGRVYDSSVGSDPLKFRLSKGKTIEGLQLGLEGMRVGGRRRLTIPPELGYGSKGFGDAVPPNSWLKLDIELLNVR